VPRDETFRKYQALRRRHGHTQLNKFSNVKANALFKIRHSLFFFFAFALVHRECIFYNAITGTMLGTFSNSV
jgi:hypothetical protein